jgi:predicted acylesterase/phospholipase RssA
LSGGGSYGCYETGVVWGLLHYGNPDDYRWDVFTGISAGSINAGMMAVWPYGMEVQMSENISYMETISDPKDTLAMWNEVPMMPGPVEGLLYHKGLVDESPTTAYLDDYFTNFTKIEKKLVIAAVDVESGEYMPFNETVGIENLGTIIRASASIPFVFEPTEFNGRYYMDGGTVWNIDLKDAVDKCLEIVDDEEHVVLDIAITEHENMAKLNETGHTFSNWRRQHSIQKYYKTMNDIAEFAKSRPNVNYRYFFKPSVELGNWKTELSFGNSTTWHYQEIGRQDAKDALDSKNLSNSNVPLFTFEHALTNHVNAVKQESEQESFTQY